MNPADTGILDLEVAVAVPANQEIPGKALLAFSRFPYLDLYKNGWCGLQSLFLVFLLGYCAIGAQLDGELTLFWKHFMDE